MNVADVITRCRRVEQDELIQSDLAGLAPRQQRQEAEMSASRQTYIGVAGAIRATKHSTSDVLGAGGVLKQAADLVASFFEADNAAFSRERFMEAAGFAPVVFLPAQNGNGHVELAPGERLDQDGERVYSSAFLDGDRV